MSRSCLGRRALGCLVVLMPLTGVALGLPPGEVSGVGFVDAETLTWDSLGQADHFNVYRGRISSLTDGLYGDCHAAAIPGTSLSTPAIPETDVAFFYVVTGESLLDGEGTPGNASAGGPRTLLAPCATARPDHVMRRTGFGINEWSEARIGAIGIDAYIDEQLDPASISESDNVALSSRLSLYDPPDDVFDLMSQAIVRSVYARRQLEQQMALFWENHFNTDNNKVTSAFTDGWFSLDPTRSIRLSAEAQHRELEAYRNLAFNGNFRQMLETCAKSVAMILYLDSNLNLASAPNENFSREIMELYSMGVNGGYTQLDVEELSRALTGWTICKKETANLNDPLAPCIVDYIQPNPPGDWRAHFDVSQHDCTAKVLFQGTPQEVSFPDTCSTPNDGVNDLQIALDAIAAHPSTAPFISRKILQLLVTEEPTQEMIDALVAVWDNPGNPAGIGDMREVTRAALTLDAFLDLAGTKNKVMTPFEHFMTAIRAVRGTTNGTNVLISQSFPGKPGYLFRAKHPLFSNEVPTGYSELGADWVDTNSILERQNYGMHLALVDTTNFGSKPITLLNDNGISTTPGNAPAIVDFLSRRLYGSLLPPVDRQRAINFLLTADNGTPDPNYNDQRIRQLLGLLLGFAQFQLQ